MGDIDFLEQLETRAKRLAYLASINAPKDLIGKEVFLIVGAAEKYCPSEFHLTGNNCGCYCDGKGGTLKVAERKLRKRYQHTPNVTSLYVGVSDVEAKEAATKGLKPPIIVSDIYSGYFAANAAKGNWGIIELDFETVKSELHPFHAYLERKNRRKSCEIITNRQKYLDNIKKYQDKWQESLKNCGVCVIPNYLHPAFIRKVITYDVSKTNLLVERVVRSVDPWNHTVNQHKENYKMNKLISDWLSCKTVNDDDFGREDVKILDQLNNCDPLEMYYIQSDKEHKKVGWWGASNED